MFIPERWVAAFINSISAQGAEAEEGLDVLKVLSRWGKSLPGAVFGSSAAQKMEKLIREGIAKVSSPGGTRLPSPAMETAIRFFILLVKRNSFSHIDTLIDEIQKFLDRKNGIVKATVEYVPPQADDARIKEAITKRTGAARVELEWLLKPELIGGYRLRIGDDVIDASIRSQLQQLEACLASGDGGN